MACRLSAAYLFAALLAASLTSATPLPPNVVVEPSPTPVVITLALCTPFVVLAILKVSYVRYRRAQLIHFPSVPSASTSAETKASRMLGLGFDPRSLYPTTRKKLLGLGADFGVNKTMNALNGYIVGCLGSPDWETRMKVRVDSATRKCRPPSSFMQSPVPSPSIPWSSVNESSRRSRTTTTATTGNRTSTSASRFDSSRSRSMSVSFLEMNSPDAHSGAGSASGSGSGSGKSRSGTTGGSGNNITNCAAVHPSSPPCADSHAHMPLPALPAEVLRQNANTKSGSTKSRRHASTSSSTTLSPTLMQVMEPVIASWRHGSPKERTSISSEYSETRSPSMTTAAFETPPTTPNLASSSSSGSSVATARLTVSVLGKQIAMTAPSPVIGRKRSMSASVHAIPSLPAATYSPDVAYDSKQTRLGTKSPLSTTTRPLNIDSVKYNLPQHKTSRDPKSLRTKLSADELGRIGTSPSIGAWELSDLMKNGQLDVDAVSDALGLGLSAANIVNLSGSPVTPTPSSLRNNTNTMTADSDPSPGPNWIPRADRVNETSTVRKCGGPLCAIPEETDDLDELGVHLRRPLSSLVERWGRVCADTGRLRESVSSSILNVDISLLGLDISAISTKPTGGLREEESVEVWEEERSWRENGTNTIGFAC